MTQSLASLSLAGVAGLALGSFAVTAGLRLSRGASAMRGRSQCDTCGHQLGFAQTVPVVSYLRLSGACAACRAKIDPTHLAGEVAGAVVVVTALFAQDLPRSLLLMGLGLTLIAAIAVDWKVRRLPDPLTLACAALCAALAVLVSWERLAEGVIAATVVTLTLLAVRWLAARRSGEPGLGLGDVKLLAALALWLGLATPWLVATASLLGLALMAITRPSDGRLAFGPAIAVSAWTIGIIGEAGQWPTMM